MAPRLTATAKDYVHPDIAVICGKANIVDKMGTFDDPKVVIEVVSPETADHDRSLKFWLYRQIPGFLEYVLISQDEPGWKYSEANSLTELVMF